MKERINIGNYEEWMLDLIEGNLNAAEEEEVRRFLDLNPDLKEELEEFGNAVLVPEDTLVFDEKVSLKKNDEGFGDLTRNEYLHIAKTEGLLTEEEQDEYALLMRTYPGALKKQHHFNKMVLKADAGVKYTGKNRLKRVTLVPVFSKETFNRAAAVAILILLFGVSWFTFRPESTLPERRVAGVQEQEQNVSGAKAIKIIDTGTAGKQVTVAGNKEKESTGKSAGPGIKTEQNKTAQEVTLKQDAPELALLAPKGVRDVLKPVKVNGYEIALDQIMPLYISYLRSLDEKPVINPVVMHESNNADNGLLAGGVKVINKLTGNFLNFKKKYDESGDVVAYTFATPNIRIDHKVKKQADQNSTPTH